MNNVQDSNVQDSIAAVRRAVEDQNVLMPLEFNGKILRTTILILAWREEVLATWAEHAKHLPAQLVAMAKKLCKSAHPGDDWENQIIAATSAPPTILKAPIREIGAHWRTGDFVCLERCMSGAMPLWAAYLEQAAWVLDRVKE